MSNAELFVKGIEDRIQQEIVNRRIKLYEYFQDKDPSRSGYIPWNHFRAILNRQLDIRLTPPEYQAIKEKYDSRKNDTFNYRLFCRLLEGQDVWFDFKGPPARYNLAVPHPTSTHCPLIEDSVKHLLKCLNLFYTSRGIDIYRQFRDVDKISEGLLTFGQFLRCFEVPSEFSENDVKLIMQKYQAPEKLGYFDYITFCNDLEWMGEPELIRFRDSERFKGKTGVWDVAPRGIFNISIKQILDKIIQVVYRNNTHLYDYLNVYDISRSGIITEKQFARGLWLAVGTEAGLTNNEVESVARYFRNTDGYIPYREFCNVIDNAFMPPYLEKNKAAKACKMDMGHPYDKLINVLNEDDEKRYKNLINRISSIIEKQQLDLLPFFQDLENKLYYPGLVTSTEFGRVLQSFNFDIMPSEFHLLCRKFEDPTSGAIFFNSFLQEADPRFQRYRVMQNEDVLKRDLRSYPISATYDPEQIQTIDVSFLIRKIRHHVLIKSLRISEFFKDFDVRHNGSIPRDQFIRGLDAMLVGTLSHECRLTPEQLEGIIRHYTDFRTPGNVLWRKFEDDINTVFGAKSLETTPGLNPAPSEYFNPKVVHHPLPSWTAMNRCSIAMEKLRHRVRQSNVNMLYYFRDFDKPNCGCVNNNQFERAMKQFNLDLPEVDMEAIKQIYTEQKGFNYSRFLEDLQPSRPDHLRHPAVYTMLKARLAAIQNRDPGAYVDLLDILFRIRKKMKQLRLILYEYLKEHDKLHHHRIPKTSFRRALSLATFEFTDSEYELLEKCFESPEVPDHVDYVTFYDMVNSVFTVDNLEKSPLSTPYIFHPNPEIAPNALGPEDDHILWTGIHRIARKVNQERILLLRTFQDFDKLHSGVISRPQFRRALSKVGLDRHLSEEEYDAIFQRFKEVRGGRKDVNYKAFVSVVNHIAGGKVVQEAWL